MSTEIKIQSRISKKLNERLASVISDLQKETPEATITTASITRAALEQFITNFEEKKARKNIVIKISNNLSSDDLTILADSIEALSNKTEKLELKKAYDAILVELVRESILKKLN